MRAVAEYVMRGRNQALWVSVLCASTPVLCWLSAAILALATLRRGPTEGAYLAAWAALPAGFVLAVMGQVEPLGLVLGTPALAALLRWSMSWQLTLNAATALGALYGLLMLMLAGNYLGTVVEAYGEAYLELQKALVPSEEPAALQAHTVAGGVGLFFALTFVGCLGLARWWQASLYNPGGFRQEFHNLRFGAAITVLLAVAMFALSAGGFAYLPWVAMITLPLTISGLSVVHAWCAHRALGSGWLAVFYLAWLFWKPVGVFVIGLAVADSWLDFRSRWKQRPDEEDSDNE